MKVAFPSLGVVSLPGSGHPRRKGAHLSVSALGEQFYGEVRALGGTRWDTSSLHARLEERRK